MPDQPPPKSRLHPWKALSAARLAGVDEHASTPSEPAAPYAELQVTTNFTFLTGASHPDELAVRAAELSLAAIAVTDVNTMAGVVRAHVAAKARGIRLVVGCRLVFRDIDWSLLAFPVDRAAYGRLCLLLTLGKRRAPKGECHLDLDDLLDGETPRDLLAVAVPPRLWEGPSHADRTLLLRLREAFGGADDRLSLAVSVGYRQDDRARLRLLGRLGDALAIPLVATNDVHSHVPERQPLQDVVTCIREGCTIADAGRRLFPNAERHVKPPDEMARLFASRPDAIARTIAIADRARFSLEELRYRYPDEVVPSDCTAQEHLTALTWAGAEERYPGGVPAKVRGQIEHELRLIEELHYAHYFLTVHDIAAFARCEEILYQGRGAAANSAVCYCLFVTAVDPDRIDVLFERFVSKERDEPPDIDIDFEHERREEVIQYIYAKYGRHRAALTAEVISYRGRSAVRDVGKALGLGLDVVDRLAKTLDGWGASGPTPEQIEGLGLDVAAPAIRRLIALTGELLGFPRHLSQHVGGFVITQDALSSMVPIENAAMPDRTVIEWDKDDIDAMGMLKVDCLGLGMLTCIRKAFALLNRHHDLEVDLATVPAEDPVVYDMVCRADTVGVFQIESRAQMSMLPRLRPRTFYDLVIEVAIVRPGPIQGNMVHPYLRRRNGQEPIEYADATIERILGKTLGVPLFQEQAMRLVIECAGFTPGEADRLRRAIAAWRAKNGAILAFEKKIVEGMSARGYAREFAERVFKQIQGFSEYGFPESHAASFALLAYVSCWLKCHHPAVYVCALLNSQPMGFYAPAQLVRDAKRHDVPVRRVDVAASDWDATLEDNGRVLRLGMRLVRGLRQEEAERIIAARERYGPAPSIATLYRRSGVSAVCLCRLARADAFTSMGLDRQQASWQVMRLRDQPMPLFEAAWAARDADPSPLPEPEPTVETDPLPAVPDIVKVYQDYEATGLSLKQHPVAFHRPWLEEQGASPAAELRDPERTPHGRRIAVAGISLLRQRPGTAKGVMFMTIEDESGEANLIIRPRVFEAFYAAARHSSAVLVRGKVERQSEVVHVMVEEIVDLSRRFDELLIRSRDFR